MRFYRDHLGFIYTGRLFHVTYEGPMRETRFAAFTATIWFMIRGAWSDFRMYKYSLYR